MATRASRLWGRIVSSRSDFAGWGFRSVSLPYTVLIVRVQASGLLCPQLFEPGRYKNAELLPARQNVKQGLEEGRKGQRSFVGIGPRCKGADVPASYKNKSHD